MSGNTVRSVLILVLLGAAARAGDDAFDRFLSRARSQDRERRRGALENLLEQPGLVPEDRWPRVRKVLISVLTKDKKPDIRGLAARCLALSRTTETDAHILHQMVEEETCAP